MLSEYEQLMSCRTGIRAPGCPPSTSSVLPFGPTSSLSQERLGYIPLYSGFPQFLPPNIKDGERERLVKDAHGPQLLLLERDCPQSSPGQLWENLLHSKGFLHFLTCQQSKSSHSFFNSLTKRQEDGERWCGSHCLAPFIEYFRFSLIRGPLRFSAPLRIRILEKNDRAHRTDVIKIKKKSDMPLTITSKPFLDSHLTTG